MALQRGTEDSGPAGGEPVGKLAEVRHHHRVQRSSLLGTGTVACPECDAPIALPCEPLSVSAQLGCPYCGHGGPVREFLSLGEPTRPTRVEVRIARTRRPATGPASGAA